MQEKTLIDLTIKQLNHKIELSDTFSNEKKAMEYYVDILQNMTPCPDAEKFVKPNANIRGRNTPADVTDQQVFQKFIRRDAQGQLQTTPEGALKVQTCCFSNMENYLACIRGDYKVHREPAGFYEGMTYDEYLNRFVLNHKSRAGYDY